MFHFGHPAPVQAVHQFFSVPMFTLVAVAAKRKNQEDLSLYFSKLQHTGTQHKRIMGNKCAR